MKRVLPILLLALAGCSTTKAWQKEALGRPTMAFRQDGIDRPFLDHAQISMEQAEGGNGGAGGGCACR